MKFQQCLQKPGKQLVKYVGRLRMMADTVNPKWTTDQRLELVRDQFIQGACAILHPAATNKRDEKQLATQLEAIEKAM